MRIAGWLGGPQVGVGGGNSPKLHRQTKKRNNEDDA
jgi:hypothetical protein